MPDNGSTPVKAAAEATKRQRIRLLIRAAGMLPVLLLLCAGFHYLSDGRFFTGQNLGIVLQQAAVNTVLAAGMTFVILTGGIDLSVGSILAASAMAGLTVSKLPDLGALWLNVGKLQIGQSAWHYCQPMLPLILVTIGPNSRNAADPF